MTSDDTVKRSIPIEDKLPAGILTALNQLIASSTDAEANIAYWKLEGTIYDTMIVFDFCYESIQFLVNHQYVWSKNNHAHVAVSEVFVQALSCVEDQMGRKDVLPLIKKEITYLAGYYLSIINCNNQQDVSLEIRILFYLSLGNNNLKERFISILSHIKEDISNDQHELVQNVLDDLKMIDLKKTGSKSN